MQLCESINVNQTRDFTPPIKAIFTVCSLHKWIQKYKKMFVLSVSINIIYIASTWDKVRIHSM